MITQKELNKLADCVRRQTANFSDASPNSHSIMWAVNYHLPLVLNNIERPIDLVNALLIAAFNGTQTSICNELGLDRCIAIGSPLLEQSEAYSRNNGKIKVECEPEIEP